jgi:hypothetical protein
MLRPERDRLSCSVLAWEDTTWVCSSPGRTAASAIFRFRGLATCARLCSPDAISKRRPTPSLPCWTVWESRKPPWLGFQVEDRLPSSLHCGIPSGAGRWSSRSQAPYSANCIEKRIGLDSPLFPAASKTFTTSSYSPKLPSQGRI